MTETTTAAAPAKGTTFTLPGVRRFTDYNGQPRTLKVTSVKGETVYFCDALYYGQRVRISVAGFAERAVVLSEPEPKVAETGPRLSAAECEALHARAHAAGLAAGEAARPTPMVVVQHAHPLDDTSPVTKVYEPVMDGVCGFAWVKVRPGTSAFARWASKAGHARKGYTGGVDIWVRGFGQSMERKEAYAIAYAKVLTEAGVTAFAQSKMD